MPVAKKRTRVQKTKTTVPTNPWKTLNSLHEHFPATLLALVAAAVTVPVIGVAIQSRASSGVHAALSPRLMTPSPNVIATKRITLQGQFTSGDPRRVNFIIDGDPVRTVPAEPRGAGVWAATWDTSDVDNGDHAVALRAEDDEASAMTGSVHVNVQNQHPALHVSMDQPTPYLVAGYDPLVMRTGVTEGASDVTFLVSQVFIGKDGKKEVTPVRRFSAIAQDASMQLWSATTDPMSIVPHASGLFEVQAMAHHSGYADTLTPGIPFILTGTSTEVSVSGVPQGDDEVNFLDIDVSSPVQGADVSGVVNIVSSGNPPEAVVAMKVSVWDGKGYVEDLPAQNVKGEWTAQWDTSAHHAGWYWIRVQAYGPAFVPSFSEPVLVHVQ